MKLGIMQPYFFPYLGYFDLINRTDKWVVFDTAQYIRHGWVNRNRILHPKNSWQYVIVPLERHHREAAIRDVRINRSSDWAARILGQLGHYRAKAAFYEPVMHMAQSVLDMQETSLSRLNVRALAAVCNYLEISFDCRFFSEMDMTLGAVNGPGDWALRICEAMGATEYINPPGGAELFDSGAFLRSGVRLRIQDPVEYSYVCGPYEFTPLLSILDVLMWNSPVEVKRWLDTRRG
jgi:hypothetical protein